MHVCITISILFSSPYTQIHFLHADNCLIPRSILLEISTYNLPSPDFILVDDYWMSFVISHHLKVPIWKIEGKDLFTSTPCAENKSIALFYNPEVEEQRVPRLDEPARSCALPATR